MLRSAVVDEATVTLAYNEALDEDSAPAPGDYTVTVDGSRVNVTAVAVDGNAVDLTLAAAVTTTQTVTVSYRVGANPVRDLADHDALGLANQAVSHDNTPPEFDYAYVNGATLTVVFNEDLDETQVPAASSFTRSIGGTTAAATAIEVDEKRATLTFAAVTSGQTVTVKYDKPTASPLRDLAGNETASIAFQPVNNVTGDTTMPMLSTQVVDGTELTLTYGETLDEFSTPAASAFAVEVDGSTASLAPTDPVEIESGGRAAKLTLAAAVTGGQTVKVSYTKPSTNPLRDLAGNAASGLNEVGVDVHGITGVEFTNQPTGDYATIGGHVEVTLTFSEAATVSGTPRIELSPAFGPGGETRYADYVSGSGSAELVFRYTLVDGDDSSTTNVSVPADGLDPDGAAGVASIKFGTEDAPEGHVSVSSGKLVSVDRPTVSLAYASVAPTVDADLDGRVETYAQGNGIKVKVRFSEALTVANAGTGGVNVQVVITIGATDHTLNYLGVSGNDLEFGTRTVAAADADTNGITVKRDGSNKLVRLSGTATVKDTDGGNDADLTGTADLGVRANRNQATPLARVRGTNAAPTGEDFTVTTFTGVAADFDRTDFGHSDDDGDPLKEIQVVTLPDSAHGVLELNDAAIQTSDLPQTVSRADLDARRLVFEPALDFIGDATFTFKVVDSFGDAAASASTATIAVTSDPNAPPSVVRVRVVSTPKHDTNGDGVKDTYGRGEKVQVQLSFNHVVSVNTANGRPRLKIKLAPDGENKWIEYESGSNTRRLTFAHTVAYPDRTPALLGVAVLANTLERNGAVIAGVTSSLTPSLAHPGLAHSQYHRVEWEARGPVTPNTAPRVTSLKIVSTPKHDSDGDGTPDTYLEGERFWVRVNFNQSVWAKTSVDDDGNVVGPRIKLRLSPNGVKWAEYAWGGGGTPWLVFETTMEAKPGAARWGGDESPNGIAVLANTLELNGATIKATLDQADASLTHTGLAADASHRADTDVCHRTPGVQAGLVAAIGKSCAQITDADLFGLSYLNLSGRRISNLKAGDFDKLYNLRTLNLSHNRLTWNTNYRDRLPEGIDAGGDGSDGLWHGLWNLRNLDLLGNPLSRIPVGAFVHLDRLEDLDLRQTRLTVIEAGAFGNLTGLKWFDLAENSLTTLPAGVFDDMTSLRTLTLAHNRINSLPNGLFDDMAEMRGLALCYNKLTSLPKSADGTGGPFDSMTKMTDLNLAGNDLANLDANLFSKLPSLQWLHLNQNDIRTLPGGIFSGQGNAGFNGLTGLQYLYLDHNDLGWGTMTATLFNNLTSLKKLTLHYNELRSLPGNVFSPLTGLQTLVLRNNYGAPFDLTSLGVRDGATVEQ